MSDYLDGDLPAARRERLERHLRECAPCRLLLDGLSRTVDALRSLDRPADLPDPIEIAALVQARLTSRG